MDSKVCMDEEKPIMQRVHDEIQVNQFSDASFIRDIRANKSENNSNLKLRKNRAKLGFI